MTTDTDLSTKEAAEFFRIHEQTLYKSRKTKKLGNVPAPLNYTDDKGKSFYRLSDLEAWLKEYWS